MTEPTLGFLKDGIKLLAKRAGGLCRADAGGYYRNERQNHRGPSHRAALACASGASSLSYRPSARSRASPLAVMPLLPIYSTFTCLNASNLSTAASVIFGV